MANYRRYSKKKEAPVKAERVLRNWSIYQMDLFNEIEKGNGNIHVEAKAGSGKTSSICEGFYHLPVGWNALMCAFAKPIQEELEKKAIGLPITVLTCHSIGYRTMLKYFPKIGRPDFNKLEGYIVAEVGDEDDTQVEREELARTISLTKGYMASTIKEVDDIMDRHDVNTGGCSRQDFIDKAIKIMNATGKDTKRLDFDDMVWMPILLGLELNKYDFVFIDEAQDLNKSQIELALNSCTDRGRILSVGDTRQAIYGFRGADSNAIPNIISRLNSKVLPLSITYRCARRIVELAQTIVPDLEAAPTAEEGSVINSNPEDMIKNVRPGDFILSRTNGPLMKYCLTLLRNGVKANILGKDLGKNFLFMIKVSRSTNLNEFRDWLEEWKENETSRLTNKKKDFSIITDKYECFKALFDQSHDLNEIKENIKQLFHDDKNDFSRVTLATTHKAKGLERDRVFMINKTYKPKDSTEEANLFYVAVTRARKELVLVNNEN